MIICKIWNLVDKLNIKSRQRWSDELDVCLLPSTNVFSKYSATLHTVLPTSAQPTPNLLHTLQICSTRSFSDVWLMMFLHYINTKQKHIKVLFCQMQINILFRFSPHPLRLIIFHIHTAPLGHSPHHYTHCMWIQDFQKDEGGT